MVLVNLIPRPNYHKNGTQWIGKLFCKLIGENYYEFFRLERRIAYAKFWYTKQTILFRFQQQYPHIAAWFSILNKADTSGGIPIGRPHERYQDWAVFNINHEGWFQFYFIAAAVILILWNYWVIAAHYDIRG